MVFTRKLSALQKSLLFWAFTKRCATGDPTAALMFAEIKRAGVGYRRRSANCTNASLSRACGRLQGRGLVLVVHGPAITRAERYHMKQSQRGHAVNYRSRQAGVRLTAEGIQAALRLMPRGTQLPVLLDKKVSNRPPMPENSWASRLPSGITVGTVAKLGYPSVTPLAITGTTSAIDRS